VTDAYDFTMENKYMGRAHISGQKFRITVTNIAELTGLGRNIIDPRTGILLHQRRD
jgi:hypothetical protein